MRNTYPWVAVRLVICLFGVFGLLWGWDAVSSLGSAAQETNWKLHSSSQVMPQQAWTCMPADTLIDVLSLSSKTVRFAVIGDYGLAGRPEADVAALVKSWNPDFIITTGDNNYPRGAAETIDRNIGQYYHEFIHPYRGLYGAGSAINRFFPVLGNHDWATPGAKPYLEYFTLPGNERYYDFVWGPVHLFAIDSDFREPDGITRDSKQAAWLRDRLAASTSPWKLVYMHHPPFSSGLHGSTAALQWPYAEWGATAVLAGHDHTYERILRGGFPYFVNGLGGNGIYRFKTIVPGSQVRYNADFGAMLIEASYDAIVFRFISRRGVIVDTYSIHR
ncbi:MAG: metallophosphoesterase [Anaerolineae bacterium]|nr:metallophosphoesterase [Anaerolineae bacterium]MDW8098767.1 metallophosphoesterase [Anaerolineae bacterium]